jgi:hypothetical protein
MLTALFAYLIYRKVSDQDLAERTDDSDQFFILIAKGLWFALVWPYYLVSISRYLATPRQRLTWNIIVFAFGIFIASFGFWNYLVIGLILAAIKGIGYLAYVYKIYLQQEQDDEEIEIHEK